MSFLFDISEFTEEQLDRSVSESCNSGAYAEMKFCTAAIEQGFEIFTPFSHATKTDVIIMRPSKKPIRVQIKKATYQKKKSLHCKDSWKFMIGSGRPSCANNLNDYGLRYQKYQEGDFDILAAYVFERDSFYFFNLSAISGLSSKRIDENSSSNNWEIFDE